MHTCGTISSDSNVPDTWWGIVQTVAKFSLHFCTVVVCIPGCIEVK